jgi:hypothetical protein
MHTALNVFLTMCLYLHLKEKYPYQFQKEKVLKLPEMGFISTIFLFHFYREIIRVRQFEA